VVERREKKTFSEAITDNPVKILGVERKDVIIVFEEEPHGKLVRVRCSALNISIFSLQVSKESLLST